MSRIQTSVLFFLVSASFSPFMISSTSCRPVRAKPRFKFNLEKFHFKTQQDRKCAERCWTTRHVASPSGGSGAISTVVRVCRVRGRERTVSRSTHASGFRSPTRHSPSRESFTALCLDTPRTGGLLRPDFPGRLRAVRVATCAVLKQVPAEGYHAVDVSRLLL